MRELRQPLSDEHRMAIGAGRLGMSLEGYRARIEAGEKWCFACRSWHPQADFPRRSSARDGLNNECRASINPRARETMRRLYQRRKLAAGASS